MERKSYALGSVETLGLVTAIAAADAGCKAAQVVLLGRENPRGGGFMVVKFTGEVASVQASVQAAIAEASRVGKVISWSVIARPAEELAELMATSRETFLSSSIGPSSPVTSEGEQALGPEPSSEGPFEQEALAHQPSEGSSGLEGSEAEVDRPSQAQTKKHRKR